MTNPDDSSNQGNTNMKVSPVRAGLLCRCPGCGKGRLFRAYLKVRDVCDVCGARFDHEDAGDGPAVFVIFIVGFAVTISAALVEIKLEPPYWVHMVLWLPMTLGLTLLLLPPFKGLLLALQFHHQAEEARLDDGPGAKND